MEGDRAGVKCNECGAVVRTVLTDELQRTLDEMELTLDTTSEICPHCGAVNLFSGFSQMFAYICKQCGESVRVPD